MTIKTLVMACAAGAAFAVPAAQAGGNNPYGEALANYKSELKYEEPDVMNSNFYGTVASNQARRAASSALEGHADADGGSEQASRVSSRDPRSASGVNVASPHIYGRVRGDVIIVVQRGAVRGNITSIQR